MIGGPCGWLTTQAAYFSGTLLVFQVWWMMRGMVAVLTTSLVPPMWMLTPPDLRALVLTLRQRQYVWRKTKMLCLQRTVFRDT